MPATYFIHTDDLARPAWMTSADWGRFDLCLSGGVEPADFGHALWSDRAELRLWRCWRYSD
jgi:hypothetical protein